MQKWEYRIGYLAHRGQTAGHIPGNPDKAYWVQDLEMDLNKFGADGWELVSFPDDILADRVDGYALFKRLKEE